MTRGDDVAGVAKERVQFDIEHGFTEILQPREDASFHVGLLDSDLDDDRALATSDDLVAVPWTYPCTHVGTFLSIPATGIDFELRGTTFVDIRGPSSSWSYFRYVDYIGALHQIGVSTDGRPVLATPDDS